MSDQTVSPDKPIDSAVRAGSFGANAMRLVVGGLERFHRWISTPRIPLAEEYFEVYGMTSYAMTLGLISHICFVPVFLMVGAPFLAAYNVFSVFAFAVALLLARRAYFVSSLSFAAVEVVIHAWLVTIWLGLLVFVHLFIALALELILLLTPVSLRWRVLFAAGIGLTYLGLAVVGIWFPPVLTLPTATITTLAALNVSIYLITAAGMAIYYSWTVQTTRVARTKAEAASQVARDQAVAALRDAEEANRAKSTFLANMSHELRTPLNAIIGYSEMIADDAAEEEVRSDAVKIEGSGRHLLSLINEILDLSKIEAGKMEVARSQFSLEDCLAPVLDTVRPLAEGRGNAFAVSYENPPPRMNSDVMKVRQILLNLLSNACKFTEAGTVSLHVSDAQLDGAPAVQMVVSDTGIGIAPEALDKIFLEFVQAEASTFGKYGGTGLGLALSRTLCELLGGSIAAESEVGKGSRFTIILPVVAPTEEADTGSETMPEPQSVATYSI